MLAIIYIAHNYMQLHMAGNLVRGLIFAFFADGHLSTKVELSTLNCKTLRTICEICTPKNFQLYRIIMPQAHNIIITAFSLVLFTVYLSQQSGD